jgi:hypothetical protein
MSDSNLISTAVFLTADVANNGNVNVTFPSWVAMALVDVTEGKLFIGQNEVNFDTTTVTFVSGRTVRVTNKTGKTWLKDTLITLSLESYPQDAYVLAAKRNVRTYDFTLVGGSDGGILVHGDGTSQVVRSRTASHTYDVDGKYTALWINNKGSVLVCAIDTAAVVEDPGDDPPPPPPPDDDPVDPPEDPDCPEDATEPSGGPETAALSAGKPRTRRKAA